MNDKRLGILVGGGPAPGINAVIGAATIEGVNQGFEVYGFYDGFRWLSSDQFDAAKHSTRLSITQVARIHFTGGSILRTSRSSLLDTERLKVTTIVAPDEAKVNRTIQNLRDFNINHLITIGGDDTALGARFVSEAAGGTISVVHVPKTIDNDLPLPQDVSTFGYATARYWGTQLVKNLMQDSMTTGRWYIVQAMGRSAGWLAMGIGQSAGATLTLIPEEFEQVTTVQRIADVIDGAMLKRRVMGRPDGVAVVAEGLAYRLGDREELERLLGREVPVDAAGHPRLSEVPIADLLKGDLQERFAKRNEKLTIVSHVLGYELRSADPTPGDMSYCRSLGHGSVRLFIDRQECHAAMIALVNGNLVPLDLQDFIDPETRRTRIRLVDVQSDTYRVARAYMLRLEENDLKDTIMLAALAQQAHMEPEAFRDRYQQAATRLTASSPDPQRGGVR